MEITINYFNRREQKEIDSVIDRLSATLTSQPGTIPSQPEWGWDSAQYLDVAASKDTQRKVVLDLQQIVAKHFKEIELVRVEVAQRNSDTLVIALDIIHKSTNQRKKLVIGI